MAPADAVWVEGLVKELGGVSAVSGLSFRVNAGEIYGLIGPNGAGKTTTFRILAGLIRPSQGSVWLAGVDVVAAPQRAKARLGFATGPAALYGRLSPRELFRYFGALHGMAPARIAARTTELAAALDISHLLDRRCDGLSTGEKQRVAVSRAVLHDPPVLILDEPTAGLDVVASRSLRDYIRTARDTGKAVLFSTHYLAEAELLCDRIGLLHHGALLTEGRPDALKRAAGAATLEETLLKLVA